MNYITYNEQFDKTSPESVIEGIKSYLSDDKLVDEQKLFGIKLLLQDNSLKYIGRLKNIIEQLKDNTEVEELKEENKQLRTKLAEAGQTIHNIEIINSEYRKMLFPAKTKKKVVIKKKETSGK